VSDPFTPVHIGPLTLKNRIIKSATNEGMAPGGIPTKLLVEYHRRVAAGGAALTTVAYCAVEPDGRTFPDQICLDAESLPHLRVLTDAVHQAGGMACAQITHGGAFNFLPELSCGLPLSSSGGINPPGLMVGRLRKQAMTTADMDALARQFAEAAKQAEQVGFDAVEIHMGHGYLLSQFISPAINKRSDGWGGTAAKRVRFPVQVLKAVLDAVGDRLAVICKYSVTEGIKGGASLMDSQTVAQKLEAAGAHLLVLSAGLNVEAPWAIFGSPLPVEVTNTVKNPILRAGARLSQLKQPKTPFAHRYLRESALAIREAVAMPLAYLGGAQSLADIQQSLDDGFDTVAMARALLHDPELPNKYQAGTESESGCTACNECVVQMYTAGGTRCVLNSQNDVGLNQQPAVGANSL